MRPSMSIWTPRAWPSSGRNSEYGKLEPTISSVSQLVHQRPSSASCRAGRSSRCTNGRSSGSDRLAEQRLRHARAEQLRDLDDLVGRRRARPAPTSIATRSPALRISAARSQVAVAAGRRAAARSRRPSGSCRARAAAARPRPAPATSFGTMMHVTVRWPSAMRMRPVDEVADLRRRRSPSARTRARRP